MWFLWLIAIGWFSKAITPILFSLRTKGAQTALIVQQNVFFWKILTFKSNRGSSEVRIELHFKRVTVTSKGLRGCLKLYQHGMALLDQSPRKLWRRSTMQELNMVIFSCVYSILLLFKKEEKIQCILFAVYDSTKKHLQHVQPVGSLNWLRKTTLIILPIVNADRNLSNTVPLQLPHCSFLT